MDHSLEKFFCAACAKAILGLNFFEKLHQLLIAPCFCMADIILAKISLSEDFVEKNDEVLSTGVFSIYF
jgi:hypothetical protein